MSEDLLEKCVRKRRGKKNTNMQIYLPRSGTNVTLLHRERESEGRRVGEKEKENRSYRAGEAVGEDNGFVLSR